jgi:hypothetical protein
MTTNNFMIYRYTSLEEFQVDCETLIHAMGCYFGNELLKGSSIGAAFIRDIMHDINVCWCRWKPLKLGRPEFPLSKF